METAWSGKPDSQCCIQDIFPFAEQLSCMGMRKALEKILGSDACPRREEAMEVKLAQTRTSCDRPQVWLLSVMFIEVADDACNTFVIIHAVIMPQQDSGRHPILAAFWADTASSDP
jgi:hypothetical protein